MHLNYVYQNNGIQTIFCTRLKTIPSSRIRTSDLRMPVLRRYSPPLYQLSYRRHWAPIYCLIQYTTHYIYIYIYAFSRRFYPKRLTLHSSFYILSALAFPGNRTHDLGVASAMLYQLSYRKAENYKLIILFRSVIIYNIPVCFLQTVYFRSPGNEVPHTLIVTHGRSFVQSSLVVVVIHLNVHVELLY